MDHAGPIRLTLVSELGGALDGGWWPYTVVDRKGTSRADRGAGTPLGQIVDIGVNWSPLEGVPDLDSLHYRGNAAVRGRNTRPQRVMTVTGSRACARLLVVPCRTSTALAVMLLRRAAGCPSFGHTETPTRSGPPRTSSAPRAPNTRCLRGQRPAQRETLRRRPAGLRC